MNQTWRTVRVGTHKTLEPFVVQEGVPNAHDQVILDPGVTHVQAALPDEAEDYTIVLPNPIECPGAQVVVTAYVDPEGWGDDSGEVDFAVANGDDILTAAGVPFTADLEVAGEIAVFENINGLFWLVKATDIA